MDYAGGGVSFSLYVDYFPKAAPFSRKAQGDEERMLVLFFDRVCLFLPLVPSFVKYELANLATVHLKSAICLKTLEWKAEQLPNSFNFCSL